MSTPPNNVLDKLLANGAIDKTQYQSVLQHFNSHGGTLEESLIESGVVDEDTLLKHLSQVYRTRYVATDKLRRADIPMTILEKLPVKIAMKHNIFPILYDEKSNQISIVTSDPSNLGIEREVTAVSGASRVRFFVARPAAIKAAISKFYKGDIHAFATLDKESYQTFHNMMDVYERNLLDEASMAAALVDTSSRKERVLSQEELERKSVRTDSEAKTGDGIEADATIELLRVMISLIESGRGELSGHSVLTARYAEQLCKHIGLPKNETNSIIIAALLHDLGKGSPYHLTAFNVAEWEGHRTTAEKRYDTPTRLIESVDMPRLAIESLRYMYERADGKGLPEGMRAQDIPLGARILALVDTFADLTFNPRNPYRRKLSNEEAIQILQQGKNKIFDPNLVDLFGAVIAGNDIKRQILTGAQTVLIVESDPEQSAILNLHLTSRGFNVRTARTVDVAIKSIFESPVNLIVSEVDLEPIDGFEFKKRLNDDDRTKNIPLIYLTSRSGASAVQMGFGVGAQDYLLKPLTIDVLLAKIQKSLEQTTTAAATAAGGVSGSLREMSMPDLVQILSHGRKSGQLKLKMGTHNGEIHFVDGSIYNAFFDQLRGEEAFFEMLRYKEGAFSLNPSFRPDARMINMSSEMLLLEGLRRIDEESPR